MQNTYIKYFFIILCSCFTCVKLLHISFSKKKMIYSLVFCVVSPFILSFVGNYVHLLKIVTPILLLSLFMLFISKSHIYLSFITSIISLGVNYLIFVFITVPATFVAYFLGMNADNMLHYTIILLFIGCIHFTFIYLIFKIRRLKSGMPFLFYGISNEFGIIASIIIILFTSFLSVYNIKLLPMFIIIALIIISGYILYFWWNQQLKNSYKNRLLMSESTKLRNENLILREDITRLSSIVHRDNKLIPSIKYALDNFMKTYSTGNEELIQAGYLELSSYIDQLSLELNMTLQPVINNNTIITTTNSISVDSVISFLSERACKANVSFRFEAHTDITPLFNGIIKDTAFTTLLSDLGENAIIATKNIPNGSVLISVTFEDGHYALNIYDNGSYFDPQVLLNMGLICYTTHKATGGSGIGLMTTYKILAKYFASFILDETIDGQYTKKLTICFDGLNQYKIKTNRDEIKNLASVRKNIIIL